MRDWINQSIGPSISQLGEGHKIGTSPWVGIDSSGQWLMDVWPAGPLAAAAAAHLDSPPPPGAPPQPIHLSRRG